MKYTIFTATLTTLGLAAGAMHAQTVLTTNNGIVRSSLCVGSDCQTGISFGDSTLILKENNTRIKFSDTSNTGSFPTRDWELEANSQSNGGANRFALLDCGSASNDGGCGAPTANVFTVEAGAGNNALYVDDGGRVGFGTGTPVVELHAVDGDTPALRLQQDGSSGFAAQTWDLAGNEASFFIRDVSNGSTLPFRIRPGAPSQSLVIDTDGDVGIGTLTSNAPLEVQRSDSFVFFRMTATGGTNPNDSVDVTYTSGSANTGELRYNIVDGDNQEMSLDADGNLTIDGELTTSGSCSVGCDRVFTAEYDLPSIEEHHAAMWENGYLPNVGPTIEGQPFNVSDKLARVLNELEHAHIFIDRQQTEIKALKAAHDAQIAKLTARLDALEAQ